MGLNALLRFRTSTSAVRAFATVFFFALTVRLIFLATLRTAFPDYWQYKAQIQFPGWELGHVAINLFEGRGFSSPFSFDSQPTAWFCPFVPYLWAAVLRIARGSYLRTYELLVVFQAIASSLSVAFYWLIADYLAQRIPGLPPRGSALTAIILSLWPETLLRLSDVWYFVWQELGIVILVWLAIRWADVPGTANSPWLSDDEGIDTIDPVYYTSAWPWDDARTAHAHRSCGSRRMNCRAPAATRSTSD